MLREVGHQLGEVTTLNNMAMAYTDLQHPDKALEFFEQALPIVRGLGDLPSEAMICYNLAMLYRDTSQDPKALECLRRAVALEQQMVHPNFWKHAWLLGGWEADIKYGYPLRKPGESPILRKTKDLLKKLFHKRN
jgi:tetratricopeptide (TPR) repeat protein